MRVAFALGLVFGIGCYDPDIPYGISCSDTGECPTGQECDGLTRVCMAPTELRTWRDDTADDFSQPGATLWDATVEPAGFVGPMPYLTGRIRLAGVAGNQITNLAAVTWADVDQARTGTSFSPDLDLYYGALAPSGLGLTATDDITVLVETEVELDVAGAWRFELQANDHGFVEIAPPGGTFTRLVADLNGPTIASYTAPVAGWYRLRGAFADSSLSMGFELRYDPPNVPGTFHSISSDRLRVRVDDLAGYVTDGFDGAFLIEYMGSTLAAETLDRTFPANAYGIDVGSASWSMRWSAQILVEIGGDYAFRVESHHGHRLWIDGAKLADAFGTSDAITTAPPVLLEPGWHDVVVDLTKSSDTTDSRLSFTVASGPAWVGQSVPVDHVRPVMGRDVRWTAAHDGSTTAIPEGTSVMRTLSLDLPRNMIPLRIDAAAGFDHPVRSTVSLVLDPPAGANITLVAAGALNGAGTHFEHEIVPTADAGDTWSLIAADDTLDLMVGNLTFFAVTLVCSGGLRPFPTTARYESAPHDLGNAVALGALTWELRQGQAVTVQFRTCDDATSCAAEPWRLATRLEVPDVPVRRFAQYAIEITTDGDTPTALDWIELTYSARP